MAQTVDQLKNEGKKSLQSGDPERAAEWYTKAMGVAEAPSHILHGNRSECFLRLKRWQDALDDAARSITLDSEWPKGYYRKGQALAELGRYPEAYNAYVECMKCQGSDYEAVNERLCAVEPKAWHVKVKQVPVLGRSLAATKGFEPGQHVLHEHPAVTWSADAFDYAEQIVDVARRNGLSLKASAGMLSAVPSLTKFQSEVVGNLSTPEVDLTNPNVIQWINAADELAHVQELPELQCLRNDAYHISRVILAAKTNIHHCAEIKDGVERPGIFRLGSKLAHSCAPNLVYQPVDNQVHFTSLRLIPADSLVTFSYRGELDFLARSNWERQQELWQIFMFWCGCERCSGSDLCRGIKCGCSEEGVRLWRGSYPSPGADAHASSKWHCSACDRFFSDEQMPLEAEKRLGALVTELEEVKSQAPSTKYTALKEAMTEVLEVLGTQHWTYGALCKRLCTYFRGVGKTNNSKTALQLATAFGAHYLRFLSQTRLYADTPLVCTEERCFGRRVRIE